MGVKEILAYVCFAGAAVSFVTMYIIPKIRSRRRMSEPGRIRQQSNQGEPESRR